jgi:hypothetical protein
MTTIIIGEIKDGVIVGLRIGLQGAASILAVLAAVKDVIGTDAEIETVVLLPQPQPSTPKPKEEVTPPPPLPIVRKIPMGKRTRRRGRLNAEEIVLNSLPATRDELTSVFVEEGFKRAGGPGSMPSALNNILWKLQKEKTIVRNGDMFKLAKPNTHWPDDPFKPAADGASHD